MRLLTSGQVSVIISFLVVVTFTFALFLSGYVVQQRTLNGLREAIKPKERTKPLLYLPKKFGDTTSDGQVVRVQLSSGNYLDGDKIYRDTAATYSDRDLTPAERSTDSNRLSKAERRRRIKEEIEALSKVNEKSGYQRRLW